MIDARLGKLESVDLRTVWKDEARDFTPWLADNLDLLGEELGIGPLELEDTEAPAGDFSVDILAHSQSGMKVVIENQLEQSNHTHLGQCLTYASGLGASIVVWVTPRLREEHRSALDWLNEHTDETVYFFGVEVSVVRIGDSDPAPVFAVEARPNDWQKRARSVGSRSRQTQSLAELLEQVEEDSGDEIVEVVRELTDWCTSNGGSLEFGVRSCFLVWDRPDKPSEHIWPVAIYASGPVEVVFQHLSRRPPFDDEALREELRTRINSVPGMTPLPEGSLTRRPSFRLADLLSAQSRSAFLNVLGWFADEVRKEAYSRSERSAQ